MNNNTLSSLFNKFAGREVQATETNHSMDIGGRTYNYTTVSPDANDATLAEIKKTADDNGLRLRVWFPGTMGTDDVQLRRLNVNVDKQDDGKWRVRNNFYLG